MGKCWKNAKSAEECREKRVSLCPSLCAQSQSQSLLNLLLVSFCSQSLFQYLIQSLPQSQSLLSLLSVTSESPLSLNLSSISVPVSDRNLSLTLFSVSVLVSVLSHFSITSQSALILSSFAVPV